MISLLTRELKIALRAGGGALNGVLFYLTVIVIFPFAIGPDVNLIARLAPAILWIGALLSTLLGLERLFAQDLEDGSLDILVIQRHPLILSVTVKAIAHWLASGLPLVIATPVFAVLLNLGWGQSIAVALTLVAGTPAITFIGLVGAAVAVRLPRGGLLIAVLILPLVIPVLIFGVEASRLAISETSWTSAPFWFLLSITLFTSVLGPLAAATMLRHSAD